jgi:predicted RNase H-like HicB family nuclease
VAGQQARQMGEILTMLTQYIEAAMNQIEIEENEEWETYPDQRFIGTIPPCQGVIGIGATVEECEHNTQDVLEEWILVRVKSGHTLPMIAGIDVNPTLEPA